MSSAEHEPTVNQPPQQSKLVERLCKERDDNGSTINYVTDLMLYYRSVPEHAADMHRLARYAQLIMDPTHTKDYSSPTVDGFHWGQVLAYSAGETFFEEEWTECHDRQSKLFMDTYRHYWQEGACDPPTLHLKGVFMQELLEKEYGELPVDIQSMIGEMASDLHGDEEMQYAITLGFTSVFAAVMSVVPEHIKQQQAAQDFLAIEGFENAHTAHFKSVQYEVEELIDAYYASRVHNLGLEMERRDSYTKDLAELSSYVSIFRNENAYLDRDALHVFNGATLCMIVNTETNEASAILENQPHAIEGYPGSLFVSEGPQDSVIELLAKARGSELVLDAEDTNPYCLLLEIQQPVIESNERDKHVRTLQPHEKLYIVLDTDDLRVKKLMIQ